MDDRLKELMQELGNAINESLSDSDRIAESIGQIREAGFDVFLVLEATIGFNKRKEDDDSGGLMEDDSEIVESDFTASDSRAGSLLEPGDEALPDNKRLTNNTESGNDSSNRGSDGTPNRGNGARPKKSSRFGNLVPGSGMTKVKWTSQDQKFLKALKISMQEDERR